MNRIKTLALTVVISIFVGCSKTNTAEKPTSATPRDAAIAKETKFTIDSLKVEDSLKISETLISGFKSKILIFPSITNKPLLDSIYKNARIRAEDYSKENLLKELQKLKEAQFDSTRVQSKDYMPDYKQLWDNVSDMNVVSRDKDFLILNYTNYGYTGGAHGYEAEIFKVFDLKNNKTIQLSDIIKNENIDWNKILSESMKNNVAKEQQEMLLVDKISANNNFYFNREKLFFVYNQYEIAAYAAGRITIPLSWAELAPYLKPEFKKRLGIN